MRNHIHAKQGAISVLRLESYRYACIQQMSGCITT